mmetsp:Transcript_148430/g.259408  ORF Transcript_148430/g.259408 Transcript_148430/m.259408 type:complete len:285 (+) Transcript_148430:1070-1924(+)
MNCLVSTASAAGASAVCMCTCACASTTPCIIPCSIRRRLVRVSSRASVRTRTSRVRALLAIRCSFSSSWRDLNRVVSRCRFVSDLPGVRSLPCGEGVVPAAVDPSVRSENGSSQPRCAAWTARNSSFMHCTSWDSAAVASCCVEIWATHCASCWRCFWVPWSCCCFFTAARALLWVATASCSCRSRAWSWQWVGRVLISSSTCVMRSCSRPVSWARRFMPLCCSSGAAWSACSNACSRGCTAWPKSSTSCCSSASLRVTACGNENGRSDLSCCSTKCLSTRTCS